MGVPGVTLEGKRSWVRGYLILQLFFLSSIAFLDRTNISVAGVQMREEFGLTQVELGWIFSAFLIGYAAFQIPAGWLAGRLGPRRILAAGVLWWGVFTALTALVHNRTGGVLVELILVRFALGIGEAVVYPAGNQFLSRWIPVEERGKANGWIFAGVGAGAGLTPPLITWIMLNAGWRASFYFCAVLGVVAGLLWYRFARDKPEDHPAVNADELAYIRAGLPEVSTEAHPATPWKAILSNKQVWGLFVSYFAFGYIVWLFFSWFFIYLSSARGVDLKSSALYAMLPFLMMTVCCLVGGVANDRITSRWGLFWGRCGLGVLSFLLTAGFLIAGSQVTNTTLAVLILAGGAGAIYLSQSSFWSVTADFAGPHAGVVSGFMNMGCQIGGAITASLTPWIAAQFGWITAFVVAAILAIIGAIAWVFVDPTKPLVRDMVPASEADTDPTANIGPRAVEVKA